MKIVNGYEINPGADLSGANLYGADFSGANLSEADLSGANLYGADLSGANLSEADLSGANLYGADLSGANLSEADLSGANLSEADLSEADLSEADLSEADLSEADLSGANLSEADLSGANLSEADLSGANLSGANLSGADFSVANLSEAKGMFDQKKFLVKNFEFTEKGIIVYKDVRSCFYAKPENWKFNSGCFLEENVDYSPTIECGCGVNCATLEWCKLKSSKEIWKCIILWEDAYSIVVPYNTDGKIRCNRLQLIEKVKK